MATAPSSRSSEQIRASMEENRLALGTSLDKLSGEIAVATDWRRQIRQNQPKVLAGAAVAGFVLAGGLAAVTGLFRRG